jgi:hypothetical protein
VNWSVVDEGPRSAAAQARGFHAQRRCPEQVVAFTELIKMRQRAQFDTHACSIDIKKAYDTV